MSEESSSSAWNLVPEFFYDVIARVVPGAALFVLLAATWVFKPFDEFLHSDKDSSVLVTCGVVLGGGYVFGLVINGATTVFFSGVYSLLRGIASQARICGTLEAIGIPKLIPAREVEELLQGYAFEDSRASGRLAKMLAERTFYECMIVVVLIAFFLLPSERKPAELLALFAVNRGWLLGFLIFAWVQSAFGMTIKLNDTRKALDDANERRSGTKKEATDGTQKFRQAV